MNLVLGQKHKSLVLGLIVIVIVAFIGIAYYKNLLGTSQTKLSTEKVAQVNPTPAISITPIPSETTDQTQNDQNQLSITPSPTPTAAPTRTPNPPVLSITYPQELQSVELTSPEQQFCVVDVPAGGDTSGLQKKHSINDSAWTSYIDTYSLCFEPKEGLNRFSIQYKNQYGEESVIYTRQFNFHRVQQITVTLSGEVYNDLNCNNVKDSDESGFANQSITIMQPDGLVLATVTSDSSGNYSFSKSINETESITITPMPLDHGLVYTPPTVTLNSDKKSAVIDISHCP